MLALLLCSPLLIKRKATSHDHAVYDVIRVQPHFKSFYPEQYKALFVSDL